MVYGIFLDLETLESKYTIYIFVTNFQPYYSFRIYLLIFKVYIYYRRRESGEIAQRECRIAPNADVQELLYTTHDPLKSWMSADDV